MQTLIRSYIEQFRMLHDGDPWLGESFEKKLRDLGPEEAFARPHGLLSVAEEVWHLRIWRKTNMRRLNGETVPFDTVEDWKPLDELREMGWPALRRAFDDSHRELVGWLSEKNDAFLEHTYAPTGYAYRFFIEGLIHHDAYHMGQIGLVIKLLRMGA